MNIVEIVLIVWLALLTGGVAGLIVNAIMRDRITMRQAEQIAQAEWLLERHDVKLFPEDHGDLPPKSGA